MISILHTSWLAGGFVIWLVTLRGVQIVAEPAVTVLPSVAVSNSNPRGINRNNDGFFKNIPLL